ncbi:MAG: ankyrin repeat domain-containing protein [Verrucomicrobiota bacterium]
MNTNDRLIEASADGQTEEVRSLLNSGAEPDATYSGCAESMAILFANGAEYFKTCNTDRPLPGAALRAAAKNGHRSTVELLLEHVSWGKETLIMSLINSAESGHVDTVSLILGCGVDLSDGYYSSLNWAARNGQTDAVEILLKRGADIHADSDSALQLAAGNGHLETVKFLVEKGADVNAIMYCGTTETPLLNAVFGRNKEIVELLIDEGANINQTFPRQESILDLAAQLGHTAIVKLLVERGADLSESGIGVLYYAAAQKDMELVNLLIARGVPAPEDLYEPTEPMTDCGLF